MVWIELNDGKKQPMKYNNNFRCAFVQWNQRKSCEKSEKKSESTEYSCKKSVEILKSWSKSEWFKMVTAGLQALEFTDCLLDSPDFRENLNKHEKELEKTSQQIKRIIKEVKDLLAAAKSKWFLSI